MPQTGNLLYVSCTYNAFSVLTVFDQLLQGKLATRAEAQNNGVSTSSRYGCILLIPPPFLSDQPTFPRLGQVPEKEPLGTAVASFYQSRSSTHDIKALKDVTR